MEIDKAGIGSIAIGNGEKCPWCDIIITEEIDTLEHLMSNHREEAMSVLFPISKEKEQTNE